MLNSLCYFKWCIEKNPTAEPQFNTKTGRAEACVLLPVYRGILAKGIRRWLFCRKWPCLGQKMAIQLGTIVNLQEASSVCFCRSVNTHAHHRTLWTLSLWGEEQDGGRLLAARHCGLCVSGHPVGWWQGCKLGEDPLQPQEGRIRNAQAGTLNTMHDTQKIYFHLHPQQRWGRSH